MDLTVGGLLAVGALVAGLLGFTSVALVVYRRRFLAVESFQASDFRSRAKSKVLDVSVLAGLVLVASMSIPWISGSVVGVPLPSTAWGLPWVRWVVAVPAVLATTSALASPNRRAPGFALLTAALFLVCAAVGSLLFELAILAQTASRATLVADTLLRGTKNTDFLIPVVREGVGAPVFTVASIAAIYALAVGYRRPGRWPTQPREAAHDDVHIRPETPVTDRFNPGDEWWE